MKLAIISHTEHYIDENGRVVGWGPTIREINYLSSTFEKIWHIAVLHPGQAPPSALPYTNERIEFVPLQPFGGASVKDKLLILAQAPEVIKTVRQVLKNADYWQFRAPTGIGVFLIPWLTFFAKKPGWFKYAGNWGEPTPPMGYRLQRFMLKKLQKRKVTINGRWPNQPAHCLSFENPCLDEFERNAGWEALAKKNYDGLLNLCFVGHLSVAKGADILLDALLNYRGNRIAELHMIGNGPMMQTWKEKSKDLPFETFLHGYKNRHEVASIMCSCHLLILPSKSEGFPKVVAEGANYGCIPVVSNISMIGQYVINGESGFLLDPKRLISGGLKDDLKNIFNFTNLNSIALNAYEMAKLFTFERYAYRIKNEILT